MKHTAAILSLISLLALSSQPALAQGNMLKQLEARFGAADKDHDGKLSKAEAKAGMPRVAQHFEKIDADNTGFITLAQIEAFMAQQKK
jgi:Ca2+-binding EF-hand superfamily protein